MLQCAAGLVLAFSSNDNRFRRRLRRKRDIFAPSRLRVMTTSS
jgi:hypothetical protein